MTTSIGKGYSATLEANRPPIALALPLEQEAVVGSIVKIDGRSSSDPEGSGLTYAWSFSQFPIGSQVDKVGFTNLESDSSVVSFAPDIIGIYKVQLVVSDSNNLTSDPVVVQIDTRIILVPYHQGITPDGSFIWDYLSDFWKLVDDKQKFDVFWTGAIQVTASELLKAYQYDYNKSIKDIQSVIQKRWISYSPSVDLDAATTTFVLADDRAGLEAESIEVDVSTGLPVDPQPNFTTYIGIPKTDGNLEVMAYGLPPAAGRIVVFGDRALTLSRIGNTKKAVVHNDDGVLANGTSHLGSSPGVFSLGMVGYFAHILSGERVGLVAEITAYINSSTVTLDVPAWSGGEAGIEFAVVPANATHTAIATTVQAVPASQKNKQWRLSATMISSAIDFEENGVSAGDAIEVEVTRLDAGLTSRINIQVVGVDGNRLGFVLNVDDLVAGQAGGGLSKDAQIQLSSDLQVPGMFIGQDRSLVYADQAGLIYNTVTSARFKRAYYETELTPSTEIDVGAFKITIRPTRVFRNRRVPIDVSVVSIPVLQEYILQPTVSELHNDEGFLIQTKGGNITRNRPPSVVFENLDYLVDDESTIKGSCDVVEGDDLITVPFGDLLDRSVHAGDVFNVMVAGVLVPLTITQIIDTEHLRVAPPPSVTGTGVDFQLKRRVGGKYVRFVSGVFSPKNPAPARLWAEVTYFDNNPTIEDNFGVLVGLTVSDLEKANSVIPYRSAVAGLMYALTTGPTVSNLHLAAQILLGLPFTQNAGVITEINPDFRLNDDGSPAVGRILVEAQDKDGQPIGVTNIYLYARGHQIEDPDNPGKFIDAVPSLQGIATNPETGKPYVVGDHVDQFVPITNGIVVQEYISQPDWFKPLLGASGIGLPIEVYHSFNILINSDLVTAADIDVAAAFIKKAKPTYTKLKSVLSKDIEDQVDVEDVLEFLFMVNMFEQTSGSFPSAVKFDHRDFNESFIQYPGTMYARYLHGDDLVTTKDSNIVSSASGGFTNARPGLIESHDTPFIRAGDVLVIRGTSNNGQYKIQTVPSDSSLQVDLDGRNFETITPDVDPEVEPRQDFEIFRPIKNPIWWGSVRVNQSSTAAQAIAGGLVSAGAAQGDLLVFQTGPTTWSKQYKITSITPTLSGNQAFTVDQNFIEISNTYTAVIIRQSIIRTFFGFGDEPVFSGILQAQFSATSNLITFNATAAGLVLAQVAPGDLVIDSFGNSFTVIRNEGFSGSLRLAEAPGYTNSAVNVSIKRPYHGDSPITADILDRLPYDSLELLLTLSSSNTTDKLATTNGSATVHTQLNTNLVDLGLAVGDTVVILEGPDSAVDDGQGAGIFVVFSFASNTQPILSRNMTSTGNVRYAIRKKRLHEG